MQTVEDMRAQRERGESQTDWARLKREQAEGVEPVADEDSSDATVALREAATKRRVGRPAGSGNKEQVAIRFDRDVLAVFRAGGPGWQTRMNDALRQYLAEHPEVH